MRVQTIRLSNVRRVADLLQEDESGVRAIKFLDATNGRYTETQKDTIFKTAEDLIYRTFGGEMVKKYVLGRTL